MFLKFLRFLLNWSEPTGKPTRDCVMVFDHTSYYDAIIMLLYSDHVHFMCAMKPQFFTWFSRPILHFLGFIEAPRLEDRGLGGVEALVKTIKTCIKPHKPNVFLISPKGTIQKAEWRSGYRHIAHGLQWPLCAAIVNFDTKSLHVSELVDQCPEKVLLEALGQGCPLDSSKSNCLGSMADAHNVGLVDLVCLSNVSMLWPLYKALVLGHWLTVGFGLLNLVYSWAYHASKETCGQKMDSFWARVSMIFVFLRYPITVVSAFCLALASLAYCKGIPRIAQRPRGLYVYWHTLFHIFISMFIYTMIR